MRTFKDAKGDAWEIALPFGTVNRVKSQFNLLEPFKEDQLAEKLNSDWGMFYDLLWILLEPQAKDREVTAEQFGQRIAAECIHDARSQFFLEWADFFHKLQREQEAVALETMVRLNAAAMNEIRKRLAEETANIEERAMPKIHQALNSDCGKLQALLESTHTPSP